MAHVYWTESLLLGVGMMDRAVTPEQGKLNNQTVIYQFLENISIHMLSTLYQLLELNDA